MKRFAYMTSGAALAMILTLTLAATPADDPKAAGEVIDVTKAEWAAAMDKDVSRSLQNVASDCTIFESDLPTRLEGRAMIRRFAEGNTSGAGELITAEMVNEKVQVYGDTAVLSYNFLGQVKTPDGEIKPLTAKSTRVYVRDGRQWWLVHANFAPITTSE